MKKQEATNTFQEGMMMDFNPLATPNNVLTRCLNGTILTYNGNENVLQNDMGNGRVHSAKLPEGYIPIGTCSHGGIIYTVSYNPLTNMAQIGSFPSPQRNFINDDSLDETLDLNKFINENNEIITKSITIPISNKILHPGDEYIISGNIKDYGDYISSYGVKDISKVPRIYKFSVYLTDTSGNRIDITDDQRKYDDSLFYIKENSEENSGDNINVDEFRNLIESPLNILKTDVGGNLVLEVSLEIIDIFQVIYNVFPSKDNGYNLYFYINWSSNRESEKERINPKSIVGNILITDPETNVERIEEIEYIVPILEEKNNDLIIANKVKQLESPKYSIGLNDNGDIYYEYTEQKSLGTPRKNDGTDNVTVLGPFQVNENDTVKYTIVPTTNLDYEPNNYYPIKFLEQTGTINIEKTIKESTILNTWKYYVDDDKITLTYGFQGQFDFELSAGFIDFYEVDSNNLQVKNSTGNLILLKDYNGSTQLSTQDIIIDEIKNSPYYWKEIENQILQSQGDWTIQIPLSENGSDDTLKPNKLYLAKIELCTKQGDNNIPIFNIQRFLYTSKIFNSDFDLVQDFDSLDITAERLQLRSITSQNNPEISEVLNDFSMDPSVESYINENEEVRNIILDQIVTEIDNENYGEEIISKFIPLYSTGLNNTESLNIPLKIKKVQNTLTLTFNTPYNIISDINIKHSTKPVITTQYSEVNKEYLDKIKIKYKPQLFKTSGTSENNTYNITIENRENLQWLALGCDLQYAIPDKGIPIDFYYSPLRPISLIPEARIPENDTQVYTSSLSITDENNLWVTDDSSLLFLSSIFTAQLSGDNNSNYSNQVEENHGSFYFRTNRDVDMNDGTTLKGYYPLNSNPSNILEQSFDNGYNTPEGSSKQLNLITSITTDNQGSNLNTFMTDLLRMFKNCFNDPSYKHIKQELSYEDYASLNARDFIYMVYQNDGNNWVSSLDNESIINNMIVKTSAEHGYVRQTNTKYYKLGAIALNNDTNSNFPAQLLLMDLQALIGYEGYHDKDKHEGQDNIPNLNGDQIPIMQLYKAINIPNKIEQFNVKTQELQNINWLTDCDIIYNCEIQVNLNASIKMHGLELNSNNKQYFPPNLCNNITISKTIPYKLTVPTNYTIDIETIKKDYKVGAVLDSIEVENHILDDKDKSNYQEVTPNFNYSYYINTKSLRNAFDQQLYPVSQLGLWNHLGEPVIREGKSNIYHSYRGITKLGTSISQDNASREDNMVEYSINQGTYKGLMLNLSGLPLTKQLEFQYQLLQGSQSIKALLPTDKNCPISYIVVGGIEYETQDGDIGTPNDPNYQEPISQRYIRPIMFVNSISNYKKLLGEINNGTNNT